MKKMFMNKKGALITSSVILVALILSSLIAGGIFFNQAVSSVKEGLTFTNPFLWIIGILVIILLIKSRRR